MRLIDADALMKEFIKFVKDSNNSDFADVPTWNDAVSLVESAPTIEPERKKGKWEKVTVSYLADADEDIKESMAIASMFCPVCERYHNEVYMYGNPTSFTNFCPNCGADMRGET